MPMPDDRLEREINEILDKIEQFPTPEDRRARARRRLLKRAADLVAARQRGLARWLGRFSLGQVMMLSALIVLGSLFFRRMAPMLMQWVLLAGVALFVSTFAIMIFGGGGSGGAASSGPRYWRGRDMTHRSPSLSERLRRWFASLRRTR